jgi:subfamily B ATP-binding cassette protein MsbA
LLSGLFSYLLPLLLTISSLNRLFLIEIEGDIFHQCKCFLLIRLLVRSGVEVVMWNTTCKTAIKKVEPQTERRGGEWSHIHHLLWLVQPSWWQFWLLLLVSALSSLMTFLYPLLLGGTIDHAIASKRMPALSGGGVIMLLALALGQGFLGFWHTYLKHFVGERIVIDLRTRLYRHLQHLTFPFFQRYPAGDLLSRLTNDAHIVQEALTSTFIHLCSSLFAVGGGLFLLLVGPQTVLRQVPFVLSGIKGLSAWGKIPPWSVIGLFLVILPFLFSGYVLRRAMRQQLELLGESTRLAEETMRNQKAIKLFRCEENEVQRYEVLARVQLQMARRGAWIISLAQSISKLLGIGCALLLIWMVTNVMATGGLSLGTLVMSGGYLYLLTRRFTAAGLLYSTIQKALEAARRIRTLLEQPVEDAGAPEFPLLPPVQGNLCFEQVDFSYEASSPTLHQVSFEARPGQVVALVGPSGAGKSAIANLVPRFFDLQGGRITLDGHDIRQISLKSLREQISMVLQEPILFNRTVRENIAYGRQEATQEEIEQVAQAVNAHDFIMQLPQGYDAQVGEQGTKLSVGQRQRIAIARALLCDSRILILDEATSALDNESQHMVQQALKHLHQARTTLVITHRLSTIQDADNIVVLNEGHVVEQGTHAELIRLQGTYAHLVNHELPEPVLAHTSL